MDPIVQRGPLLDTHKLSSSLRIKCYLLASSAGCSSWRGCSRCPWTGIWCWSSCLHFHSLSLLPGLRLRSASRDDRKFSYLRLKKTKTPSQHRAGMFWNCEDEQLPKRIWTHRNKVLTLGLVSTTYMKSLWGLDLKMASSICSSSRQRALKPDSGWLLRQMAAWKEERWSSVKNDFTIWDLEQIHLFIYFNSVLVNPQKSSHISI